MGSFINVVISRRDWYRGRSRCDSCGCTLKWYDLIPVISFLFLKGKCRVCGKKINIIHPVSELYMGCAFLCSVYIYEKDGLVPALLAGTGLFFLCIAAVEDMKEQMVHSSVLYCGMLLLFAVKITESVIYGSFTELITITAVIAVIKVVSVICKKKLPDKIGDGDFDLFVIMVLALGAYNFIVAITISCLTGLIICLPVIFFTKNNLKLAVPFAPFLYIGSMITLFIGGAV